MLSSRGGGAVGWRVKGKSMKVLTYNVRDLGGGERRAEVRRLVNEKQPMVLCLQESKWQVVTDVMIKHMWGDVPCDYSYCASVGASGGLVTVWDTSRIVVWASMNYGNVLVIKGKVILTSEEFMIFNVYAPCDMTAKRDLWNRLRTKVLNNNDVNVCVCVDFNSVHSVDETKGRGTAFRQAEADFFNDFINTSLLIDMPICGRLFTWYKGDGVTMSRLDRLLLSDKWSVRWANSIQIALQRGLSDHVPVLLSTEEANWGPRPLRMLKCWSDFPRYGDFVREQWGSFQCQGWGGYVLKEKLKMVKLRLKEWHKQHIQNLDSKILAVKDKLSTLDKKAELSPQNEDELHEIRELSVNLHSMARVQNSVNWQKSRMNWLKEGDANSKFFHGVMSGRKRHNTINMVLVDGAQVEGVNHVQSAVFNHFSTHYKASSARRPGVGGLQFRQLSGVDAGSLILPFSQEEVKQAIWDCDSFKSPGPDGVSFGFLKELGYSKGRLYEIHDGVSSQWEADNGC